MEIDKVVMYIEGSLELEFEKYEECYYYITEEGKIVFLIGYKSLNDIEKFMDTINIDDFYSRFSSKFKDADKKQYVNFKAFLWDLYIIAINIGEQDSITDKDKFRIEKDRFLARKIIVDSIDSKIISRMNIIDGKIKLNYKNLNENECDLLNTKLNVFLEKVEMIIEPEKQLNNLIDANMELDDSVNELIEELFEDQGIKQRVEEISKDCDKPQKDKVLEYLKYIADTNNFTKKED